jgi:hypothetical protein
MLTQLRSQRSQRHRQIRRNELDLNGSIWLARVTLTRLTQPLALLRYHEEDDQEEGEEVKKAKD